MACITELNCIGSGWFHGVWSPLTTSWDIGWLTSGNFICPLGPATAWISWPAGGLYTDARLENMPLHVKMDSMRMTGLGIFVARKSPGVGSTLSL